MGLIRAFIGVPPDPALRDRLAGLRAALAPRLGTGRVRWIDPRNYHLTLAFIGNIDFDRVTALQQALLPVARSLSPFEYLLDRVLAFPSPRHPVVIAAIPHEAKTFGAWHAAVSAALRSALQPFDERRFRPHFSLARLGRTRNQPALDLDQQAQASGRADSLALYSSEQGAYHALFSLRCGAETAT